MDSACYTMPYLESLSTGELLALAESCGLDIPLGLERVFIIEEILCQDTRHHGGEQEDLNLCEIKETAPLPRSYNVSFVDVHVRDPLWAFVFWEVKEQDREAFQNDPDFSGYYLRVIPLRGPELQPDFAASFAVTVNGGDTGWYVGFSPDDGRCFKIELCILRGETYTALAESRSFVLPRLIRPNEEQPVYRNPLAQLSGVESFSLVHSEDRVPPARGI